MKIGKIRIIRNKKIEIFENDNNMIISLKFFEKVKKQNKINEFLRNF